jgi:hypothetical protein
MVMSVLGVYAYEILIRVPCPVGPNLQLSDHGIFEDMLGHPALRQPGIYKIRTSQFT